MKIRNIPYGYCIENGNIVLNEKEVSALKQIFDMYLSGKSMLQIAEWLNSINAEYMPNVIGWNKARIKRILEDKHYIGDSKYLAIIDKETFEKIQQIKYVKNDQKAVNKESDIYQINVPVRCPYCNEIMQRKTDNRRKNAVRWKCKNKECNTILMKTDNDMLADITDILNSIIVNPNIILLSEVREHKSFNSEIIKIMYGGNVDKDNARKKLIERFSQRYKDIDSSIYTSYRLQDEFKNTSIIEKINIELLKNTVDEIHLYSDGNIGITLENKQTIRKGENSGTSFGITTTSS